MTCWVSVKRKAQPDSINIQEIIDIERVFADIEMLTQCKQHLYIQQTILDMNVLNNYYKSMLKERDYENFKPYIKSLLQENIPDISFI